MTRTFLLASLLLVGCQQRSSSTPGGGGPENPGQHGGGARPTASLAVVDEAGAAGPFRLDDLDALVVEVEYKGPRSGSHAVRIDAIDPRGQLFAQLPATLVVERNRPATSSNVLRVRGTSIDRFHQVGTWQFVAHVDGTPLARASADLTE